MLADIEPTKEEDDDEDEDFLNGKVIMAEPDPEGEEEGADADGKSASRKNSSDKNNEGASANWDKAKKLKNVSLGPAMPKPKMDMAKALTIMGFSSTRSLDPHTNDTRGVLAQAVDKKELLLSISLALRKNKVVHQDFSAVSNCLDFLWH